MNSLTGGRCILIKSSNTKSEEPHVLIFCRYLGFKKTFQLDRRRLVELVDLHHNQTLSWDEFSAAVRLAHETKMGQSSQRRVIADKPKEEEYFYANPEECLCGLVAHLECYRSLMR